MCIQERESHFMRTTLGVYLQPATQVGKNATLEGR